MNKSTLLIFAYSLFKQKPLIQPTPGFSPSTPISSHKQCWLGELGLVPNWDYLLTDLSSAAVLRDQTWVKKRLQNVPFRKITTQSCWATSFAIQLFSTKQGRSVEYLDGRWGLSSEARNVLVRSKGMFSGKKSDFQSSKARFSVLIPVVLII